MRYYECTNCNLQVSEETAEAIRNQGTHTNAGARSSNRTGGPSAASGPFEGTTCSE
jgi:hypothetical protein